MVSLTVAKRRTGKNDEANPNGWKDARSFLCLGRVVGRFRRNCDNSVMSRLQLVNKIAEEILSWSSNGLHWRGTNFRIATKSLHNSLCNDFPTYFRPDLIYMHAQIVINAVCQQWDATYNFESLVGREFQVVFQNKVFRTYERKEWQLGVTNLAVCNAALEFHRVNVAHEKLKREE